MDFKLQRSRTKSVLLHLKKIPRKNTNDELVSEKIHAGALQNWSIERFYSFEYAKKMTCFENFEIRAWPLPSSLYSVLSYLLWLCVGQRSALVWFILNWLVFCHQIRIVEEILIFVIALDMSMVSSTKPVSIAIWDKWIINTIFCFILTKGFQTDFDISLN